MLDSARGSRTSDFGIPDFDRLLRTQRAKSDFGLGISDFISTSHQIRSRQSQGNPPPGEIKVSWVDTKLNIADALTKAMAVPRFEALTAMMRRSTVLAGRALAAMRAALTAAE